MAHCHVVTPFSGQIPGGFRPGCTMRIKGRVFPGGRCTIDFVNSPTRNTNQDIVMHISVRPQDNAIVRNHFQNGSWAHEERNGGCAIRFNEPFDMSITADHHQYTITVNNQHLGTFRHRLPLYSANFIIVDGQVSITQISYEQNIPAVC